MSEVEFLDSHSTLPQLEVIGGELGCGLNHYLQFGIIELDSGIVCAN